MKLAIGFVLGFITCAYGATNIVQKNKHLEESLKEISAGAKLNRKTLQKFMEYSEPDLRQRVAREMEFDYITYNSYHG